MDECRHCNAAATWRRPDSSKGPDRGAIWEAKIGRFYPEVLGKPQVRLGAARVLWSAMLELVGATCMDTGLTDDDCPALADLFAAPSTRGIGEEPEHRGAAVTDRFERVDGYAPDRSRGPVDPLDCLLPVLCVWMTCMTKHLNPVVETGEHAMQNSKVRKGI